MGLKIFKLRLVVTVAALILTNIAQASEQRAYVNAIHSQYLSTDFKNEDGVKKLLLAVKRGLEQAQSAKPEDLVSEENLLGLYNQVITQAQEERLPKYLIKEAAGQTTLDSIYEKLKAYESKNGKIVPLGWSLPEEFKIIVAGVDRKYDAYKGQTGYSLGLFGWLHDAEEMPEQVQVIRYPNTVILDKESGIGDWSDGRKWKNPKPTFSFGAELDANPPKDGLYLLNLKMKGKKLVQGWFVVSAMTLSEAPLVSTPFMGQVLKSENPTVKWLDFTSQKYRNFESRKRMLFVYKIREDSRHSVWGQKQVFPDDRESVVVEAFTDNDGNSDVKITKGNYEFEATFQERWFVGDLLMQRSTTTKVPFSVSR